MNSKYIRIAEIICCFLGILITFKIIFYFFSTSELWTIIILGIVVLLVYGIQISVWDEQNNNITWFGLKRESEIAVYEQVTIFGIIPISSRRRRYYDRRVECPAIQKAAETAIALSVDVALRFLPLGGVIAPKAALKALSCKKQSS